jgi:hypothetical protein
MLYFIKIEVKSLNQSCEAGKIVINGDNQIEQLCLLLLAASKKFFYDHITILQSFKSVLRG